MYRPSPHFGAVYVFIHPRGLRVSNSHKVAKTERRVSHIVAHFFMEEYLGNEDLLDRYLVAFFASRNTTEEIVKRVLWWAEEICQTDKVVISGFHSPLEKEVLRVLLEHKHPVIIALGRALYKKVPSHLQSALDEGRLLFVSYRGYSRHSAKSAEIRNWAIADIADEVYFTPFDRTSLLSTMHYTIDRYGDRPVHIL